MKVYVAGPMTGYEDWNRPAFHAAAARLRSFGYEVVNPAELDYGLSDEDLASIPHHVFLHRDLKALLECDLIYPLPGAEWSKGATLEMTVAAGTGIFTLADPDLAVWREFEGRPLEPEPENNDDACHELTCPAHGEENRRAAEIEGLDSLAEVFPFPVKVDESLPANTIRVDAGENGVFDLTFDLEAEEKPAVVQRVECDAVEGDGAGNEWCSHGVQVRWADEEGGVALDEDDKDPHLFPWQQAFARYLHGVLGGGH